MSHCLIIKPCAQISIARKPTVLPLSIAPASRSIARKPSATAFHRDSIPICQKWTHTPPSATSPAGILERSAVLRAICDGFKESSEPAVCLSPDIETNECLEENGGCWQDTQSNITACKDTFRGRICECPITNGVQYQGDGYTSCKAVGPARCNANNGGCWVETKNSQTFSACSELDLRGCNCPFGFRGDGLKCEDVDECMEKLVCQCDGCTCKNTWGGFDCKCKGDLLYIKGEDVCIAKNTSRFGWLVAVLVLAGLAGTGVAVYIFYKYRLRSYMDSEIMSIMSQYMPLDNQQRESQPLRQDSVI